MSKPYALPVGPTRLAESRTSMPPPEPKSSTVSPGFNSASAVGLPHPSDASTAASGKLPVWPASYKLLVIGSQQPSNAAAAPQHELPPLLRRRAAWPYFSRTISLMSCMVLSYLQMVMMVLGLIALLRVQHSA